MPMSPPPANDSSSSSSSDISSDLDYNDNGDGIRRSLKQLELNLILASDFLGCNVLNFIFNFNILLIN